MSSTNNLLIAVYFEYIWLLHKLNPSFNPKSQIDNINILSIRYTLAKSGNIQKCSFGISDSLVKYVLLYMATPICNHAHLSKIQIS